jgi:hypothetical protein
LLSWARIQPDFTGRENVVMAASSWALSAAETRRRMDAIIAFAGIGDFIDQPVKTYSSGMFVRLAFSVATSIDPTSWSWTKPCRRVTASVRRFVRPHHGPQATAGHDSVLLRIRCTTSRPCVRVHCGWKTAGFVWRRRHGHGSV